MKRSSKKMYSRRFMNEFVREIKKASVREFKEGIPELIAYQFVGYTKIDHNSPIWKFGMKNYATYVMSGLDSVCFKEDEK